jgi:hypothetical protein
MQHGRDHDERQQKLPSRLDQQLTDIDEELPPELPPELDRRARSRDPAPTEKAVEAERARHERQGTRGGNP